MTLILKPDLDMVKMDGKNVVVNGIYVPFLALLIT